MFRGMDEVDWASMEHAYGSAADVPELLRGLASQHPPERETALDGMYGAVHHQGDVYDSTLASIPFLFALVRHVGLPDRGGIVELLASIGGEDEPAAGDEEAEDSTGAGDPGERDQEPDNHAMARAAVRAGAPVFLDLMTDGDPEVRRAAPTALVRFHEAPERVLALLTERLADEQDDGARLALVEGLGLFARLHPALSAPAVDLLTSLCAAPHEPGLRLAALGQVALCAPDRLPADLVTTVVTLLHTRSRRVRPSVEPTRTSTDTLIGRLRRMRPADEEGAQLLRTLHSALGARTSERIALLKGQLSSTDAADRCNAVWMSAGLFREWRAAHAEPVALIGEQLTSDEERLRQAAVSVLEFLFDLAEPAADRLADLVASDPDSWGGPATLGGPLRALARTGDARAVPVLAEVLRRPVVPNETGWTVRHLGPAAVPLAPLLRERLAEVPLDDAETFGRAAPLLSALGALRYAAAVPEVLRLLRGTPPDLRMREALVAALSGALAAFGPAAHDAIPALRGLLGGGSSAVAAAALWSVEGDAEAVLPPLLAALTTRGAPGRSRVAAADALARMGPDAAPALGGLRSLTDSDDVWERTAAARALWDIAADPEPVLPVFRGAWRQNPCTRGTITACLVRMGDAGAPVHDLVAAELASPRRHRARSGGYGSHDVLEDETLLRTCRAVLGDG